MWRNLAEGFSREKVLTRRLPPEFGGGQLFVSPEGGLRYWHRDLARVDNPLLQMAKELVKPGDSVWDIGANVGLFTFASAALAGPAGSVLAIEADTWLVGLLRRSALLHYDSRAPVHVLPAAVSNSVGVSTFCVAARARAANALQGFGTSQAGGSREEHLVISVTLDWLLKTRRPPHILKIDVEGAEACVLEGGLDLLSRVRPIVLCEVSANNIEVVSNQFKKFNYTLYDADQSKDKRTRLDHAVWNTLACPGPDVIDDVLK